MNRDRKLTRRDLFRSAVATGTGLAMTRLGLAEASPADGELNVGIIGLGKQGRNLLLQAVKLPGLRFRAICDIWPYHQTYAQRVLKKYHQNPAVYGDYEQMLAQHPDLDAVIIATPDWMHAEQTLACLQTGAHVYCEAAMAHTLSAAREMTRAARTHSRLLQIGLQRRSNPRYQHAVKLIRNEKMLGEITAADVQANAIRTDTVGWPAGKELDAATLKRYGYDSMEQLCNWRWYRACSAGPMASVVGQQIDVLNWYLGTSPQAVLATGGHDTVDLGENFDNVMAVYEYAVGERTVRSACQMLSTSSYGGSFERFFGTDGTLVVSDDGGKGHIFREVQAERREWEDLAHRVDTPAGPAIQLKIGETIMPDGKVPEHVKALLAEAKKNPCQLHLENFFDAIRGRTQLTCPGEVALPATAAALGAIEAAQARKTLDLPAE